MNIHEVDESMAFLKQYATRSAPMPNTLRSTAQQFAFSPSHHQLVIPAHSPTNSATATLTMRQQPSLGSSYFASPYHAAGASPSSAVAAVQLGSPSSGASLSAATQQEQRIQFMALLSFIRKRYLPSSTELVQSEPSSSSLSSLSDAEVTTMLDAFAREARSVLHKERTWQTQVKDGTTTKRVNFPPQAILHESVSHPKSPPPSPRGAMKTGTSSTDAKSESDEDADGPTVPLKSKRRQLKEGMRVMRKGEGVVKFSTSGKPQRRFLRVEDCLGRAADSARSVLAPHLCWSETESSEASASSRLSLLTLQAVQHGKLCQNVQRDRVGDVRNDVGEVVALDQAVTLTFQQRPALTVVFRTVEISKKWAEVLQLVINKNEKIASGDV